MGARGNFSGCSVSLTDCRCFQALNKEEQDLVDANSVIIEYKKGEVICKRGGLATHIMYLEKGLAKVFLDDGMNTLVLKILPEKNLIGLATVSDEHNTFEYSVMAYVDSEVRQIDSTVFKKILRSNAEFAKEVIEIMSANSIQIYSRFFCFTHKQSFGRLADIILCLADRVFKSDEFDLPLSRKELAELSGLSAETVIRMLKKFREEGLVGLEGKRLKVIDYSRLKVISENG
jgi:CRP/FNR family transcriptional regulator